MPIVDVQVLQTIALVKEGSALVVLLCFLIIFARAYLRSVSAIAAGINQFTLNQSLTLTKVADALGALTLQIMRNNDVIVRCQQAQQHKKSDQGGYQHE